MKSIYAGKGKLSGSRTQWQMTLAGDNLIGKWYHIKESKFNEIQS
jgi:hypothetical protein